jgi:thiamine pyrophosphate-dependent acetolactate synthase large subunit-like protein
MTDRERALIARQPAWVQRAMERRALDGEAAAVDDHDEPRPRLALWWPRLTAWWRDEVEPTVDDGWLAAWSLRRVGLYAPHRWWLFDSWRAWGVACPAAAMGALALVKRRDRPFVGWVAGADDAGRLVLVTALERARVVLLPIEQRHVQALRWPAERTPLMAEYAMRWIHEGAAGAAP